MPDKNYLLEQLSPAVRAMLLPHLEHVDLPARTPIYNVAAQPTHVHFLLSGISSMVVSMADGELVEVGLVGNEGFPEYLHLLGPQTGTTRCFMQTAGNGLRMSFDRFQSMVTKEPELLQSVHRLVQHQAFVLAQTAACNRLHSVSARLARWLLMVYDRVGEPELCITQEGLAAMIGSRRSSINIAAVVLQQHGSIQYARGRIILKNPALLQSFACECYPVVRKLYFDLVR